MRSIQEMFQWLKDNVTSHDFEMTNKSIIGKRKYKTRSFSNFRLTYLTKSNEVSCKALSYASNTIRFSNDDDLICHLGCMASTH